MAEGRTPAPRNQVAAKDVFGRSNMPSRWERMTGVAPKTAPDRKYLAFLAARYRGEQRTPHPEALETPHELHQRQRALYAIGSCSGIATAVWVIGVTTQLSALVVVASAVVACSVVAGVVIWVATAPALRQYRAMRSQCELAESRLHANPMDSENTSTIDQMITCDEGTLAYCAAKIASEIEQDPAWRTTRLEVIAVDLRNEVAEVGESARQIADDRKATEALERGRLRDDPEVRATIADDKRLRNEAVALLAARVYAFADYRDRLHRHGVAARRDAAAPWRAMTLVADEQARDRLL